VVAGGLAALGFAVEFAVGGVAVADAVVVEQPVLGVVVGDGLTVGLDAVAVVVVAVAGLCCAVLFDFGQSSCEVVAVVVGGGDSSGGFCFLGNTAQSSRVRIAYLFLVID
jgi:hypothetical protein